MTHDYQVRRFGSGVNLSSDIHDYNNFIEEYSSRKIRARLLCGGNQAGLQVHQCLKHKVVTYTLSASPAQTELPGLADQPAKRNASSVFVLMSGGVAADITKWHRL
jgi:hypothetical protein